MGPVVAEAIGPTWPSALLSGFLLFFLLFLVQDKGVRGWPYPPRSSTRQTIALLAAAAGLGGLVGAVVANWTRNRAPSVIVLSRWRVTAVTTVVAAVFFGLWTAVAVSLVTAFAQELGKLALDAIVQREIGEEVRSSTFGVVEAMLQLAWVFGGLVGLVLSLFAGGRTGLAVMATVLAGSLGWLLARRRRRSDARDAKVKAARADHTPDAPSSTNGERHSEERIRPEPAGTTTAIVRRDDPPTEKRTRPLTNPHG